MTTKLVGKTLALTFALVALIAGSGVAQSGRATVMGRVTNEAGAPLDAAQVSIVHQVTGARRGSITGADGRFMIVNVPAAGPYRIEAQRIGYGSEFEDVAGLDVAASNEFNFVLGDQAVALDAIEVFAERADESQTPIAFSTVDQIQIQRQLASRDIPLILNTKPSVYATESGGGSGDARINVRGFSQRDVAVMINGVPVNDMENGWVYWSNWDGVADFTESLQLQRGLSAVNLATASIGGSLNLITDPTTLDPEIMVKQEFGNDEFLKTTAMASTGLIDEKYALMGGVIRKQGEGIVPGLWTDAWAYYGAASWVASDKTRLDLYATGAPQRHGQRLYAQNIGALDADYALGLDGYDPAALNRYPQSSDGILYNENVSSVSCSYDGLQATGSKTFERYDCGFLNERENYYHKPQVNLNLFTSLTDDLLWSTVGYYSGGTGGGSGTLGSLVWDYDSQPSRIVNYDATIARNQTNATGSRGILRNSVNEQWTVGAISKLEYSLNVPTTIEVGVDYRLAQVQHYREVRDLLGGAYYLSNDNDFNPGFRAGLGDRIDYNNTNDINWIGAHLQTEYLTPTYTAFGMVGVSGVNYTFTDHFLDDGTGNELVLDAPWQHGFQVKGGGLYNFTDEVNAYLSGGYVEKMPIFDQVIDDVNSQLVDNTVPQKFLAAELGTRYSSLSLPLELSANAYWTQWLDRTDTQGYVDQNGEDIIITLTGVQQRHMGLEFEANYQPLDFFRFDGSASLNSWEYTDDVNGNYKPGSRDESFDYAVYLDGLKVGNAPQTQFSYGGTIFPVNGGYVQLVGKTFMRQYSDFNPFDRTDATDRVQSWQIPDYSTFDLHAGYTVPSSVTSGFGIEVFANVFNLFDGRYITDATDNSSFNAFDDDHDADDAEVHFGLPRRFTLGARIAY